MLIDILQSKWGLSSVIMVKNLTHRIVFYVETELRKGN